MTVKEATYVHKLADQAEKAVKIVLRNRFLIETYLSLADAKEGKRRVYKSAKDLFKKLEL